MTLPQDHIRQATQNIFYYFCGQMFYTITCMRHKNMLKKRGSFIYLILLENMGGIKNQDNHTYIHTYTHTSKLHLFFFLKTRCFKRRTSNKKPVYNVRVDIRLRVTPHTYTHTHTYDHPTGTMLFPQNRRSHLPIGERRSRLIKENIRSKQTTRGHSTIRLSTNSRAHPLPRSRAGGRVLCRTSVDR